MVAKSGGDSKPIGVLKELEAIKRLLIFALLRQGAKQGDVAKALGVNQSSISRMFPTNIGEVAKRGKKSAE